MQEITLPNTVITGSSVFYGCSSLREVNTPFGLRFSIAQSMFKNCTSLTSLDVSGWDMSACTNCRSIFESCSSLTSLDVSGWDMSACKDMCGMFLICSSLSSIDVSGWDVSACLNMANIFNNCRSLTSLLGGSQDKPSAFGGAKVSLSFVWNNLDKASLIAIINGIADLTGKTQQTLDLGAINKAKLTADEITIATNKNWKIT